MFSAVVFGNFPVGLKFWSYNVLMKLEWGETAMTGCVKSAGAVQTAAEVLFQPITL